MPETNASVVERPSKEDVRKFMIQRAVTGFRDLIAVDPEHKVDVLAAIQDEIDGHFADVAAAERERVRNEGLSPAVAEPAIKDTTDIELIDASLQRLEDGHSNKQKDLYWLPHPRSMAHDAEKEIAPGMVERGVRIVKVGRFTLEIGTVKPRMSRYAEVAQDELYAAQKRQDKVDAKYARVVKSDDAFERKYRGERIDAREAIVTLEAELAAAQESAASVSDKKRKKADRQVEILKTRLIKARARYGLADEDFDESGYQAAAERRYDDRSRRGAVAVWAATHQPTDHKAGLSPLPRVM